MTGKNAGFAAARHFLIVLRRCPDFYDCTQEEAALHSAKRGTMMIKKRFCLPAALLLALLLTAAGCAGKTDGNKSRSLADGVYQINVSLSGGTGKASVSSPARLWVREGKMTAELVWSSKNYDYMLVEEQRYDAKIVDGHSVFEIPVAALDTDLRVIADTTAMSVPHEIEYTLRFDRSSLKAVAEDS